MSDANRSAADRAELDDVRRYWSEHLNLTQFLPDEGSGYEIGSPEFFEAVRRSLDRFRYKQPLLDEIWEQRSGDSLIEIGCGLGADLVELAGRGFDVVGVDLSPPVVELAARHLEVLELRGSTQEANAESLPFEDGTFDHVYSSGVFQHTPEPPKAISEAIRVLRPGGKLTVILYHRRSWFWLLSRLSKANVEFENEEAPIVDSYRLDELHAMFAALPGVRIRLEHYRPVATGRSGALAGVYNSIFVPISRAIPDPILRPFGFHAVIQGTKA